MSRMKDFLTEEETREMELLLKKVEKGLEATKKQANTYLLLLCQCKVYEQVQENRKKQRGSCMADMQVFLAMICQFCREHGCCQCQKGWESEIGEEDDLPF